MSKIVSNMERIIAKIDNDFNPDNSDWIPRVAAWTIDLLQMLDVLQTERKRRKLIVKDKIAYSDCPLDTDNMKVYDSNGCEIVEAGEGRGCCNSFTGDESTAETSNTTELSNTMSYVESGANTASDRSVFTETTKNSSVMTHDVTNYKYGTRFTKNYVVLDNKKLELNFDDTYVIVETDEIKTCRSEVFGCDIPVIPNNGLLIECIVAWCMYKMLCRGFKHPVMNLTSVQPFNNPYVAYMQLKDKAKTSVINNMQKDINDDGLWRSNFFIDTFNPKR